MVTRTHIRALAIVQHHAHLGGNVMNTNAIKPIATFVIALVVLRFVAGLIVGDTMGDNLTGLGWLVLWLLLAVLSGLIAWFVSAKKA